MNEGGAAQPLGTQPQVLRDRLSVVLRGIKQSQASPDSRAGWGDSISQREGYQGRVILLRPPCPPKLDSWLRSPRSSPPPTLTGLLLLGTFPWHLFTPCPVSLCNCLARGVDLTGNAIGF